MLTTVTRLKQDVIIFSNSLAYQDYPDVPYQIIAMTSMIAFRRFAVNTTNTFKLEIESSIIVS